jgi:hypothetical protein
MTESMVEVLLAIDRCVEISSPQFGKLFFFRGNRTWLWMVPVTIYGCLGMWYVPAFMFSGVYFTWFFYPYVGYKNDFQLQLQVELFFLLHF